MQSPVHQGRPSRRPPSPTASTPRPTTPLPTPHTSRPQTPAAAPWLSSTRMGRRRRLLGFLQTSPCPLVVWRRETIQLRLQVIIIHRRSTHCGKSRLISSLRLHPRGLLLGNLSVQRPRLPPPTPRQVELIQETLRPNDVVIATNTPPSLTTSSSNLLPARRSPSLHPSPSRRSSNASRPSRRPSASAPSGA